MDFFDYLYLFGGLSLFLFGMKFLSSEMQSRADERLKNTLLIVSGSKYKGFFFGVLSTALIQSSSAITAMMTDFAGAGILPVENTVGIIIGSNVGTTVTAWLIGAAGINASIPFFSFLKPAAIASLFSIIGIIFYNTGIKNDKRKKQRRLGATAPPLLPRTFVGEFIRCYISLFFILKSILIGDNHHET